MRFSGQKQNARLKALLGQHAGVKLGQAEDIGTSTLRLGR